MTETRGRNRKVYPLGYFYLRSLASRVKFKGSKKEKQTCAAALVGFFLWCWKQQIYAFFGSSYLLVQIICAFVRPRLSV
jgi:hypothetical protein